MSHKQCAVEALEGRRLLAASYFPFRVGSTGTDTGDAIAADNAGNVLLAGNLAGSADANPSKRTTTLAAGGGFVGKYASDGSFMWARQFNGAAVNKISIDRANNVYVAGSFSGTVDFDPRRGVHNVTSRGGSDAFVLKLSSKGNLLLIKTFGGVGDDVASGLAVDRAGDMWIGGTFRTRANFNPNGSFKIGNSGGTDGFITALTKTGAFRWAGSFGGAGDDTISDLALDGSGNVLATGNYLGNVDFDPTNGTSSVNVAGTQQSYVLKWDSSGGFVFADGFGGTGLTFGASVTAGRDGSIYALGSFSQTADFDPGLGTFNVVAPPTGQVYALKLNSDGTLNYAKAIGGSSSPSVGAGEISVDKGNNVTVTGVFNGTQDFDPDAGTSNLTAGALNDVFIVRLDPSGALGFAKSIGAFSSRANDSVLDRDGNILLIGNFGRNISFPKSGGGTISINSLGNNDFSDLFAERLDSTGSPV